MLSGGLDSLYCLHQAFIENQDIHIHHLHLKNIENRAVAESIAVKNILNYYKDKHFIYTESMHVYPVINNHFIWDLDICSFMAGTICQADPEITHILMGLTLLDTSKEFMNRFLRSVDILTSFFNKEQKIIYPAIHMTKRQVYDALPANLRLLAWSCRRPIYINDGPIKCGECIPCRSLNEF